MGGMKRTLATLGKGGGHRSPSVWKHSTGQVQINMFKLQHTHMSICSPTLHNSTLQRRERDFGTSSVVSWALWGGKGQLIMGATSD